MLIFLSKVWTWLKKNWKYILFPVAILVAVFAIIKRGPGKVVAPKEVETEPERQKANEEAHKKAQAAAEARQKAVEKLETEHAGTIEKLTDKQKERVSELRENPDELNKFLLDVGKGIRG